MVYLVDPAKLVKQECFPYCLSKCGAINYPMYGIPPIYE